MGLVFGAAGSAWLVLLVMSFFSGDKSAHRPLGAIACDLVAVGLLVAVAQLLSRYSGASEEDQAWRLILSGVALIAGFALVTQSLGVLGAWVSRPWSGASDLAFSVGCALACAPVYRGLVHWNRIRPGSTDPGEALNGLGAFFVAVAFGNLLLPWSPHPLSGLREWQEQASLATGAAIVILFGTAMTVTAVGGLLRDPRIWIVTAAIGAVCAGQVAALLAEQATRPPSAALWLFMATVLTSCTLIAPGAGNLQALNHQATVVGAMVVMVGGVTVVIANAALVHDQRRLTPCFAAAGLLVVSLRMVKVVQDVAQIRREAMTDDLTGLPNRRALLSAIEDALLAESSASLLIVDLERFKMINDRYGHATGDLLLQDMARTLAADLPEGALLARLGGDEFAVLLTDIDIDEALEVANTLTHKAIPLECGDGYLVYVKSNIGVATINSAEADSAEADSGELLRRADTALDQAKTAGTRVCEYDRALDAAKHERLSLIEDLRSALEGFPGQDEQIVVYYQPQILAATGVVVGVEALVRWAHPRRGILAPDAFIDLAEQNGLMASLTARVMRQAAIHAVGWRAAGHRLRLSVNLSATCLNDPDLPSLIDEVLGQGLDAGDLVLEVTETSLMTDAEQSLAALKRLAERGVGISIDDYGTGYSSLSYLNDLPATELKIDRSFTSRIVRDPRTAAIVAGTVELAHRLGIRIVAEGIEDEETLTAMRELGCDETQGYFHSRPLPDTLFLHWLQAREDASDSHTPAQFAINS